MPVLESIDIKNEAPRPYVSRKRGMEALGKIDQFFWFFLFGASFIGFLVVLFHAVIFYLPNRSVTIPYRATILGVALLVILISLIRGQKFYSGWLWIPLILFFAAYSLRIVHDGYFARYGTFMPASPEELLLMASGACLIPAIAFMRGIGFQATRAGFWGFISVGIIGALMCTAIYWQLFVTGGGRMRGGQYVGDYIGISPLGVAYMGSALTVVGLSLLVLPKTYSVFYRRILPAILVGVGLFPMMIGASRGPLVAILVCGFMLFVSRLRERQIKSASFISIIVAGLAAIIFLVAQEVGSVVVDRFIGLQTDIMVGTGAAARLYIWTNAIQMFSEAPLFGAALTVPGQAHPHNFVVEAFLATGIVGGICFLMLLIGGFSRAFQILRHHAEYAWIAILFIHYAVNGMFSSSIGTLPYFWYSLAAVLGVSTTLGIGGQIKTNIKPIRERLSEVLHQR